jgi:hypothetical protein
MVSKKKLFFAHIPFGSKVAGPAGVKVTLKNS